MNQIICRSPQEIIDDEVITVLDSVNELLNRTCNGRLLYTGPVMLRLISLRNHLEAVVLGECQPWGFLHHRLCAALRP